MTSSHSHLIDAQLSLSILFLAINEGAHSEQNRVTAQRIEPVKKDRETPYEEPERWDGLW
jgi:hypothetical protein